MWRADAHRLAWLSGTNLGREVVPEVCSNSAVSPGRGLPTPPPATASPPTNPKVPAPALRSATSSITGIPDRAATARAGESTPRSTTSAAARRSAR